MTTCKSEHRFMTALRLETPDKVTNFVQSILPGLQKEWKKVNPNIPKERHLKTPIGDFTVYKNFGYDTHWHGAPRTLLIPDGKLRRHLFRKVIQINKGKHRLYVITPFGAVYARPKVKGEESEKITWYIRPGIETEEELRFFVDHVVLRAPSEFQINRYRKAREICMNHDFLPIMLGHITVEPGMQGIGFALTAKLMRSNPKLLHQYYDLLSQRTELSFKAGIKAGYKCFVTADDCAFKIGPIFSPKQYHEFVTPYASRICEIVRNIGGVIFMHTDGLIDALMNCFIDAGFHAIQPLEPSSGMSIERVKKNWGEKLAVIGNVDTTDTLSFGTPQDSRDYVHRCFREARGESSSISGYVFAASGSLHNKVKIENAMAMLDEYRKIRDGLIEI